jgi:predicted phosphohydrolase
MRKIVLKWQNTKSKIIKWFPDSENFSKHAGLALRDFAVCGIELWGCSFES